MIRKSFPLLLVVLALLSVGVVMAAAQDNQPTTPPFGRGMMGHGQGMMIGMGGMSGMTTVAEALNLEPSALIAALQSGQTLAQIAETQGIELQTVTDAMLAAAQRHMADLVAAGTLTQEEADEHLAYMSDHITEMPMFSGAGCQMMGMNGMGGMLEHRHGMRMGWNS